MTTLSQEERSRALWSLTIKQSKAGAELDKEVAAVVFGVPLEVLDAWRWGMPEFSTDRTWASHVIQEMWSKPDRIRLAFERHLQTVIDSFTHKGGLAEMMFVCMPWDICHAALATMAECDPATATLPASQPLAPAPQQAVVDCALSPDTGHSVPVVCLSEVPPVSFGWDGDKTCSLLVRAG